MSKLSRISVVESVEADINVDVDFEWDPIDHGDRDTPPSGGVCGILHVWKSFKDKNGNAVTVDISELFHESTLLNNIHHSALEEGMLR